MRKGYAPKTRRLAFQQLESRQLLAIFTSQWGGRIEVVMDPSVPWVTHEHAGGPTHNIMVRVLPTVGGTVHNAPVTIVFGDDAGGGEAAFAPPAVTFQALDTGWANVTLSGKDTRPFKNGDTVYAYEPESGLSDLDNSIIIEGNTVFPRACRVLRDQAVLGPSHRIVMRRPDGTEFPLPGVRWSPEDALVLTIGDRLPQWSADPQGASAGEQYIRDRSSRPR